MKKKNAKVIYKHDIGNSFFEESSAVITSTATINVDVSSSGEQEHIKKNSVSDKLTVRLAGVVLNNATDNILVRLSKYCDDNNYSMPSGVTTKQGICIIVDTVLKIALENITPFCSFQGSHYLFTGKYYQLQEEPNLKSLLTKAAIIMGIKEIDARYFAYQQLLIRQFFNAVPIKQSASRSDKVLVNLANGTFAITREEQHLLNHSADNFIIYMLPFAYDKTATYPLFQKYLDKVLPDINLQKIIAEFLAYCLTNDLKLEKTLILIGKGSNGKSVLFEIVNALLGKDNVSNYSLQSLTEKNGYQRVMLGNKRVNYASEISTNLNSNIFKQLTSGEPIGARAIYQQPIILRDYAKLIFNCNELPIPENTEAYFRRMLLVPFNVTIAPHERDVELSKKIIQHELAGVFNWVLEGMKRLLSQNGFTHSDAVEKMLEQYKNESDTVRLFLNEYRLIPHATESEQLKTLYENYRLQCTRDGYRPINKGMFRKGLENLGFIIERKNVGNVVFIGKSN